MKLTKEQQDKLIEALVDDLNSWDTDTLLQFAKENRYQDLANCTAEDVEVQAREWLNLDDESILEIIN
jgi:gamma-glutamyl phosphate reductase